MNETLTPTSAPLRSCVEVRGIVQGVGFRPFVHRLAGELALDGFVRNDGAGVTIEVQGDAQRIAVFVHRLATDAPRLARVDSVTPRPIDARTDPPGFAIVASGRGRAATAIGPDSAICDDCLRELFDPADRRYRYPFVNCTNCGPRYTLTHALPYDRAMTSMAVFEQCAACLAEYADHDHRRFHAEPNACPRCGPALCLLDGKGAAIDGDPLERASALLAAGAIVAVKGLGGFHLACDARNEAAVAALRERKAREEKPFAIMVANAASLDALAQVGPAERKLLEAPERPIVLLRKRAGADAELRGVAPGLAWLGAMLPYTPLQYLLFHEAAGRPAGTAWLAGSHPRALVMTSANPGGEPLVIGNVEAQNRLAGIADAFLLHDRDIVVRCDDSVVRALPGGAMQFVRRARGYTPRSIRLARTGPTVVAVGGHFKNTACVTRGDEAFLSQHVGDLDNAPTCLALGEAVEHLLEILEVEPALVAHDLHADYFSTRHAGRLAARFGARLVGVQHHHAHVASVCAEHRVTGPVLGLALDGVGLGLDRTAWGGELLRVDGARVDRLGHLAQLRLPGGDRAAREPWRMAVAAMVHAGLRDRVGQRLPHEPDALELANLVARGVRSPLTSSAGRWFDAAAGLLGVRRTMAFEGQAAMLLEGLAEAWGEVDPEPGLYVIDEAGCLDFGPLIARLADERDAGRGAARFHATFAAGLADWTARAAAASGIRTVACGGGCFLNAILARSVRDRLARQGLAVLEAQAVPPNDGGLALGQAWVALLVCEEDA